MRKSSIEWLEERLTVSLGEDIKSLRGFFVIAKEIHKDEIEYAHIEGQRVFDDYQHTEWTNHQAEDYYNRNFNNKENG